MDHGTQFAVRCAIHRPKSRRQDQQSPGRAETTKRPLAIERKISYAKRNMLREVN